MFLQHRPELNQMQHALERVPALREQASDAGLTIAEGLLKGAESLTSQGVEVLRHKDLPRFFEAHGLASRGIRDLDALNRYAARLRPLLTTVTA
jgi:hypothetical protein